MLVCVLSVVCDVVLESKWKRLSIEFVCVMNMIMCIVRFGFFCFVVLFLEVWILVGKCLS